jgi:hypothetical protein
MVASYTPACLYRNALAALVFGLGAASAVAADLDYRAMPNDRFGSAYEDPRYADLYAPAPPRGPIVQHHAYGHAPIPREPVYQDEPLYQREEAPPPRTYGYQPQAPRYSEQRDCISPRAAERALANDGWREFANLTLRGPTAIINARRPDGRPFELQLDRCSGELVKARPLDQRPHASPYASPYGPNVYGGRYDPRAF